MADYIFVLGHIAEQTVTILGTVPFAFAARCHIVWIDLERDKIWHTIVFLTEGHVWCKRVIPGIQQYTDINAGTADHKLIVDGFQCVPDMQVHLHAFVPCEEII